MSLTRLPGFTLDTSSNVTFANANVTGNLTSGNANLGNLVTANFFSGNGSLLTGITITGTYSNTNTAAYLPTYTGNVSANYFIGDGSLLTSITGANITGNAPFAGTANYANTANSITGTNVSGNVSFAIQSHYANIANSVTGTNVSGNVTSAVQSHYANIANAVAWSGVSSTPTTISGYGITDSYSNTNTAAYLTANPQTGSYSNTNTAAYLPTYTGNFTAGNINLSYTTTSTANLGNVVRANYVVGNGYYLTGVDLLTVGNADIANSIANGTSNINTPTANGSITVGIGGTANVVVFNTTGINLAYASNSTANLGNVVRANYFVGNGAFLTGVDLLSVGNADIANSIANGTSNINTPTSNGNITVSIGGTSNRVIFTSTGVNVAGYISPSVGSGTNGIIWPSNPGGGTLDVASIKYYAVTGEQTRLEINVQNDIPGASQDDIYFTTNSYVVVNSTMEATSTSVAPFQVLGGVGIAKKLFVGGNIEAGTNFVKGNGYYLTGVDQLSVGNADIANSIANGTSNINTPVANGNITVSIGGTANSAIFTTTGITANTFTGNLFLSVSGTTNAAIVSANMAGSDYFRILVGGTATDGGFVEFATADNGNEPIYFRQYTGAGTFTTVSRTLTLLDASGDTYIPGKLTTTGNIIANAGSFFLGNGYYLTGVDQLSVGNADIANSIANGTSNISTPTANGNITVGIGGTANTVIFTNTGVSVAGTLNVTGNAFVGNLTVNGTTTTVNSTTTRVVDPIFELGGGANGAALSTDDNKDRGLLLHYYSGSSTVDAFMGWDDSNGEFGFGSNVSVSSEVITWNSYANVRGNYFIGDGSLLTGVDVLSVGSAGFADVANSIANGTSNVNTPYLNGPITVGVGGAANAVVFTSTGINVAGYSNIGGTVIAGTGTGGSITGANAITSNYFIGDGSLLTSITGANVSGNVTSAVQSHFANIANSVTFTNVSGTPTTLSGYGITDAYSNTNTAAYLTTYTGNLTAGNINLSYTTTSTANLGNAVGANYFVGDGSLLTGITASYSNTNTAAYLTANPQTGTYSNTNVASYLPTYTGNLIPNYVTTTANSNITLSGSLSQISGANLISGTYVAGTLTTAAQPNITSVGTLSSLTVGNATANTIFGNGTITSNGNISFTGASVSLGTVGNISITGGAANYFLKTDGAGSLSWAVPSGGAGGTSLTYTANTAPLASGNVLGDQWFNTATNVLYEYINDGTSSYWVDTSSPSTSTNSAIAGTITIQDEGSNLTTAVASIDFVGAGVTATNTGNAVTVTIPSGSNNARTTGYSLVFGG